VAVAVAAVAPVQARVSVTWCFLLVLKLNVISPPVMTPTEVGMHATSTAHVLLPLIVLPEQLSVVIVKPAETETLVIFIFFLAEGSEAVSVCGVLVCPTTTAPKESAPGLTWSVGSLESGDDAASSDCASTGRASAPIRNNSAKVKAASDRTNDLKRI